MACRASAAGGVGDSVEPSCVVSPQGDELGDGGVPSLRAGAPVGGSAEAEDGGAGVAGSIAGLALGAAERLRAVGFASAWHGCSPLRDAIERLARLSWVWRRGRARCGGGSSRY